MDWLEMLQRFGFPVCMVLVFIVGISRVSSWLGEHVLKPMVKSHIEFLDKIKSLLSEQHLLMERQEKLMERLAEEADIRGETLLTIQRELREHTFCRYPATGTSKHPPT